MIRLNSVIIRSKIWQRSLGGTTFLTCFITFFTCCEVVCKNLDPVFYVHILYVRMGARIDKECCVFLFQDANGMTGQSNLSKVIYVFLIIKFNVFSDH